MAAVHPQNVIFTPMPLSPSNLEGRGHRPNPSSGSITSGITASDAISGGQYGSSMSNCQLLGNTRHPINPDASIRYSYTQREPKWTFKMRTRTMRTWRYARLGLTAVVLSWVVYCTIRYFIAVRIYREDHVRSRYALGMGVASAFTIIFFACETLLASRFSNNHFFGRLSIIIHSLAYLSSALLLGLTIINLVLVNVWRTPRGPAQFARSIQGRCHWDLDVVWSGTGMACAQRNAKPFGVWLGAAIVRSVASAVLIIAYHLMVAGSSADRDVQQIPPAVDAAMGEVGDRRPGLATMNHPLPRPRVQDPLLVQAVITASEDELQRRSLSFTAAGQVLSRIEGSEYDDRDGQVSSTSSSSEWSQRAEEAVDSRRTSSDSHFLPPPRTNSPEILSPTESASSPSNIDMTPYLPQPSADPDAESEEPTPDRPPSSYLRTIASPSNDLQDFASAFQALVSHVTRETEEGMTLDGSPRPTPRLTVRVLGSYISRMSTIDSLASREASSPVRSQSRSDTIVSHGSGSESRDLSPTSCSRDRDRDEELQTSSLSGTGSSEGPSS